MNHYLSKLARTDDESRLISRLEEIVQKALLGQVGRSDFLDLRQQELAQAAVVNTSSLIWELDGGYEQAERKRLLAYPEWESKVSAKIAYLRITSREHPAPPIGHRDYLGAVLNLGLKREKLGDIVVQDQQAYMMVDVDLADFIGWHLTRVKHSQVEVEMIPPEALVFQPLQLHTAQLNLASLRVDAAVARAFNLSRAEVNDLVAAGQVRLNQLQVYKGSAPLKTNDLISVRGQGRFRLENIGTVSRKGRQQVQISRW